MLVPSIRIDRRFQGPTASRRATKKAHVYALGRHNRCELFPGLGTAARSALWVDGRACVHIQRGGVGRGRGRDVRRQSGKQHRAGGLGAAARRADGRVGRERYGDVQPVVGRGTQEQLPSPNSLSESFFSDGFLPSSSSTLKTIWISVPPPFTP